MVMATLFGPSLPPCPAENWVKVRDRHGHGHGHASGHGHGFGHGHGNTVWPITPSRRGKGQAWSWPWSCHGPVHGHGFGHCNTPYLVMAKSLDPGMAQWIQCKYGKQYLQKKVLVWRKYNRAWIIYEMLQPHWVRLGWEEFQTDCLAPPSPPPRRRRPTGPGCARGRPSCGRRGGEKLLGPCSGLPSLELRMQSLLTWPLGPACKENFYNVILTEYSAIKSVVMILELLKVCLFRP